MRVMKRGAVAENFLDSLAVRLQSIRLGKGRGWRRFLVFSELTKSKKGAEYVALFAYFGFQCEYIRAEQSSVANTSSLDSDHLLPRSATSSQRLDALGCGAVFRFDCEQCWIHHPQVLRECRQARRREPPTSCRLLWHAFHVGHLGIRRAVTSPLGTFLHFIPLALYSQS